MTKDNKQPSLPDFSFTGTGTGTFTGTGFTGTSTTGSWAQDTHSVIWMTNTNGPGSRLDVSGVQWRRMAVNAAIVVLATLIASTALIAVYGSVGVWARAAVPAAVLAFGIVMAGALRSLRLWWQLFFLVVAQWVIGPVVCLNDTAIGHVLPSLRTLHDGWFATFGSFKYLVAIAPPVSDTQGALMAVWTLVLWVGVIAGFVGSLNNGKLSIVSTLLVLLEFCGCALLGTQDGWFPSVTGLVAMLMLVAWMSWRWQLLEAGRLLSCIVIVVTAGAIAFGGCLLLPQHRTILRDVYEPPLSPYDYTSPLSGMRAFVRDHKDDTLLTVRNLPEGTAVRLAVMDRFDGNVWNLSDSREASDSSNYTRVGTNIHADTTGTKFTAQYTVHTGMRDDWLPLAGAATSVTFDPTDLESSFYYNTGTDTGLLTTGLKDGLTYTETGVIPEQPTDEQIAKASVASIKQPTAQDVPNSISKLATATAGGKSQGGEAAQDLAQMLRDQGWFSHGLGGEHESLPGHGNYRLTKLLAGTAMVGDSEQYASAMALMARELGLPSRVVMGFLPKNQDGDIDDSRTQKHADGTVIDFTGNDVTAWVEIHLAHYGWVPFYPTPKETKIPDEDQDLTPPNPETLVHQPPLPLTDPLRDEQNTTGQSSLDGDEATEDTGPNGWATFWHVTGQVALYGSPLWIVLGIAGLILLIKALQLAYVRRHGNAQVRVGAGWQSVANLALQSGMDLHGTRSEQALQISQQLHVKGRALHDAQSTADYAAFSGMPVSEEQVRAYWQTVDALRKRMLFALPRWRRLRTRLSLRGVWHASAKRPLKDSAVHEKSKDTAQSTRTMNDAKRGGTKPATTKQRKRRGKERS
ncbi:DUF3488 and transglutaminase-like domain-containing protein [Bifidobacterium gallicum]|uniref:Transglutaminase n=1 Tax=Bifidobacterium gallicum DSM 20093 = LMG 11596 TaxID=561180 RepID=D1NTA9_9BIFI|nr:transglutaminase domain-containing protein [Bifidobacterium gallicum]EFA22963.1 hypothetical protein BIFGAL_03066 [Bifidobacterium gallicum DSM 20093 = LMG 11596]KFI57714.1 transglutaminase [Bifidobacterium gallicum DSM 20093 = LMG 11596]